MGTYIGSPWGFIRGKIGDTVGGAWKGIDWARVRVLPTQRGTLDKYRQLKDGVIQPEVFSYPQMNIRRVILQVLGHIGRVNLSNLMYPVWEALVTKRGWTMTGINAFVKRSAATFFSTLTDKELEYDNDTNLPDPTTILMSDGDLEPAAGLLDATYDDATGAVVVTWDATTFTNGAESDYAFVVVLKLNPDSGLLESIGRDGTWYPGTFLYGTAVPTPPPGVQALRVDATMTLEIPIGLDPNNLYAYLFFRDAAAGIGHSPSISQLVVAVTP